MSATITGLIGGGAVVGSDYYFSMYLQNNYTVTLGATFSNMLWDTVQTASPHVSYDSSTGVVTLLTEGRYAVFMSLRLPSTNSNGNASCSCDFVVNGTNSGIGATYKTNGNYSNGGTFQASYDNEIIVTAGTTLALTWSVIGLTSGYSVTMPGGLLNGYFSTIAYKGLS